MQSVMLSVHALLHPYHMQQLHELDQLGWPVGPLLRVTSWITPQGDQLDHSSGWPVGPLRPAVFHQHVEHCWSKAFYIDQWLGWTRLKPCIAYRSRPCMQVDMMARTTTDKGWGRCKQVLKLYTSHNAVYSWTFIQSPRVVQFCMFSKLHLWYPTLHVGEMALAPHIVVRLNHEQNIERFKQPTLWQGWTTNRISKDSNSPHCGKAEPRTEYRKIQTAHIVV